MKRIKRIYLITAVFFNVWLAGCLSIPEQKTDIVYKDIQASELGEAIDQVTSPEQGFIIHTELYKYKIIDIIDTGKELIPGSIELNGVQIKFTGRQYIGLSYRVEPSAVYTLYMRVEDQVSSGSEKIVVIEKIEGLRRLSSLFYSWNEKRQAAKENEENEKADAFSEQVTIDGEL
jgi:hypothetical protein